MALNSAPKPMSTKPQSEAGFTLVELMVTVTCMVLLAATVVPRMSGYMLQGRLDTANAYLAQIAAKQRMFKITSGTYCCTTYKGDENVLVNGLGLNLADMGDYCFLFVCQDTTICPQATGPGFITAIPGGPAAQPDFEVWAILQTGTGPGNTAGPGSATCTPAAGKATSTGFAAASSSGQAGRAGQVVALRYPPPVNGLGSLGSYHAVTFNWHDGISKSDAQYP